MRELGLKGWLIAVSVVVVAALAVLWWSGGPTKGQAQGFEAPRLQGTDKPDLNGIWQAFATANWDVQDHSADAGPFPRQLGMWGAQRPGQGVVEGNEIPYRPEALAKKQENYKNRLAIDQDNLNTVGDPEAKCYLPGVPRATYVGPFRIVQGTNKLVIAYEYAGASRTIPLNKSSEAPVDFWMGWSNGQWEGDTLVVDVKGFNGMTWFDRAGNYHSEALHVVERYTPITPYHMMYEATIDDPNVFTRPWKITMPLYRRMEKDVQLLEFKCIDLAEEYLYGGLLPQSTRQGGAR